MLHENNSSPIGAFLVRNVRPPALLEYTWHMTRKDKVGTVGKVDTIDMTDTIDKIDKTFRIDQMSKIEQDR